jgi:DNA-binding transcriptional MerR regulator
MNVSELATELRTTADTVRYYTRLGLLSPNKASNGYRFYSAKQQSRLKFILSARQLGFAVEDISVILQEADDGKTACPVVREIIKQRLAETEKRFQQMLELRDKMQAALVQWEKIEDKSPTPHMVCHLIEQFGMSDNGGTKNEQD